MKLIFFLAVVGATDIYVRDFGANVEGQNDVASAQQNGQAICNAFVAAKSDDTIIIKKNETMYFIPTCEKLSHIENITFRHDGLIWLHDNTSAWPMKSENQFYNAFEFNRANNLTVTGNGTINGQGYTWWYEFLVGDIVRQRPTVFEFDKSIKVVIEGLAILDSPRFNVFCDNVYDFKARYMTIWVNTTKQVVAAKVARVYNYPMFPFNTDGIDFRGQHAHIHDISLSNYDDCFAMKPFNSEDELLMPDAEPCTMDVLVENINIFRGAGLSIGSVSSSKDNCVRNIVFRDIIVETPLKLIYIKTGSEDDKVGGTISNITYENIYANDPVLRPIEVGPQQQKEPDGTGHIWSKVNKYVSISNITLKNVHVDNANMHPGMLRCSLDNPCTGFEFINVTIESRKELSGLHTYLCEHRGSIFGSYDSLTDPSPAFCIDDTKNIKHRIKRRIVLPN